MVFRDRILICRRCRQQMTPEAIDGHDMHVCQGCDARFVDEPVLAALYSRASKNGRAMPELVEHADGDPRVHCPVCDEEMERVWLDLLGLDRCPHDGVWLDAGELDELQAQAKAGPVTLSGKPEKDTVEAFRRLGFIGLPGQKRKR
jgi:Zn-finger nucleic acid-binding protein